MAFFFIWQKGFRWGVERLILVVMLIQTFPEWLDQDLIERITVTESMPHMVIIRMIVRNNSVSSVSTSPAMPLLLLLLLVVAVVDNDDIAVTVAECWQKWCLFYLFTSLCYPLFFSKVPWRIDSGNPFLNQSRGYWNTVYFFVFQQKCSSTELNYRTSLVFHASSSALNCVLAESLALFRGVYAKVVPR